MSLRAPSVPERDPRSPARTQLFLSPLNLPCGHAHAVHTRNHARAGRSPATSRRHPGTASSATAVPGVQHCALGLRSHTFEASRGGPSEVSGQGSLPSTHPSPARSGAAGGRGVVPFRQHVTRSQSLPPNSDARKSVMEKRQDGGRAPLGLSRTCLLQTRVDHKHHVVNGSSHSQGTGVRAKTREHRRSEAGGPVQTTVLTSG